MDILIIAAFVVAWLAAGLLARYLAVKHSMSRWGRNIHTNKWEQIGFGAISLFSAALLWAFFPSKPAQ